MGRCLLNHACLIVRANRPHLTATEKAGEILAYDQTIFAAKCAGFIDRVANARHNTLVNEYDDAMSRAYQMRGEGPDVFSDYDQIRTQEGLNEYAGRKGFVMESLRDAAEEARRDYRAAIGTPSDEALRVIQTMSLQDKLNAADVRLAVERYGDQLDAFNAIKAMAKRSGVEFYYHHPLEHGERIIDMLESATAKHIDRLDVGFSDTHLDVAKAELNDIAANRTATGSQIFY